MRTRTGFRQTIETAVAGIVAALTLSGCADTEPIKVHTAYGPGLKFAGVGSTYAWAPAALGNTGRPRAEHSELHELILRTVDDQLSAKGFEAASSGNPDFLMDYRVGRRTKTDATVSPHGVAYEEGALALHVIDPESGQLIWRGTAQARLSESLPPQAREARIRDAVYRLMEQFPSREASTSP